FVGTADISAAVGQVFLGGVKDNSADEASALDGDILPGVRLGRKTRGLPECKRRAQREANAGDKAFERRKRVDAHEAIAFEIPCSDKFQTMPCWASVCCCGFRPRSTGVRPPSGHPHAKFRQSSPSRRCPAQACSA